MLGPISIDREVNVLNSYVFSMYPYNILNIELEVSVWSLKVSLYVNFM